MRIRIIGLDGESPLIAGLSLLHFAKLLERIAEVIVRHCIVRVIFDRFAVARHGIFKLTKDL